MTDNAVRWDPYLLLGPDDLSGTLEGQSTALGAILGVGFDPRCTALLAMLSRSGILPRCRLIALDYSLPADAPTGVVASCLDRNQQLVAAFGAEAQAFELVRLGSGQVTDRRRIARQAIDFANEVEIGDLSHVLVDVSALPRTVFFPLLGALLKRLEGSGAGQHLLVAAAESVDLDRCIVDTPGQRASYVVGFAGGLDQQAERDRPLLWMPMLGEDQAIQLRRVYELLAPDEIAPVLPSPAAGPRRADELVGEYHQLLFDEWRVEPANMVYVAERNPFEVYRQLRRTVRRYDTALGPLGGCRVGLSSHTSKLMSLGALLAAYQCREDGLLVGVAHVESDETLFRVDRLETAERLATEASVHTLWISDARPG